MLPGRWQGTTVPVVVQELRVATRIFRSPTAPPKAVLCQDLLVHEPDVVNAVE
jgi:hypothetical protein